MSTAYEAGRQLHAEMVRRPQLTDADEFGDELQPLSWENVFGNLWTRPGLDRRDRSLVTLGILATLRATDEMEIHFEIARRNGLTVEELEEVVYHVSGYAGFPAAATARRAARVGVQAFDDEQAS